MLAEQRLAAGGPQGSPDPYFANAEATYMNLGDYYNTHDFWLGIGMLWWKLLGWW